MRLILASPPEALRFDADRALAAMYILSPFVWRDQSLWRIAVRAVPRSENKNEKISRVHFGVSEDGIRFHLDSTAALSPGTDADDKDGCEDPTVIQHDGGDRVFYSGWNQSSEQGHLLSAVADTNPDLWVKQGRVLTEPNRFVNAKEASVAQAGDGTWRLMFEYSTEGRSAIGVAVSDALDGPWTPLEDPLERRPGSWDDFHLSPGPFIVTSDGLRLLFYNGANSQTQWRIGWAQLDANCTTIVSRCIKPLITPAAPVGDASDIAFCSSAVPDSDQLWLYYSISDKDCFRVSVQVVA